MAYRAGMMPLREIGAQNGITEGAIRKRAWKLGWVRKIGTQVRKKSTQPGTQKGKSRTAQKQRHSDSTQKSKQPEFELPPHTKPESARRRVVTNHPPLQPGNQHALKHGGYARRLLFNDEITEDARALTLEDELFRLRANNLTAAENIGRWQTMPEDADSEEMRKGLRDNINAADKAMLRNTVRIKSLVGTLASVGKTHADEKYHRVTTEKVSLEVDRLRSDAGTDRGYGERDLNDFYADIEADAESGPEKLLDDTGA